MQLVIQGAIVLAHSPDAAEIDAAFLAAHFPAADRLVPYAGAMDRLGRVGPAPAPGAEDLRPYAAPGPAQVDLSAYAATKRYLVETGGVTVAGRRVRTDERSQSKIAGATLRAQVNLEATTSFKAADGFVVLPGPQMQALGEAVAEHVQACFAAEARAVAAVAKGTAATFEAVDAFFAGIGA